VPASGEPFSFLRGRNIPEIARFGKILCYSLAHENAGSAAPMSGALAAFWAPRAPAIVVAAALLSAALIVMLRPFLERYALAQPNARSSHKTPTPQGGGIAVTAAMIAVSCGAVIFLSPSTATTFQLVILLAAVILIAAVGVAADIHPIGVAPRLLVQALAVTAAICAIPESLRVLPVLPWWIERAALLIAGWWFVNLVNFMDGLDWMTVAEVVPVSAALAAIGLLGILPPPAIAISLALCGATLGFACFNRPVARLFLGDVGSLPIGLVLGWLLILTAAHGGRAAAILLPLYYLADATITLARRALNGEPVWQAHRSHFYQRATDRGFFVIGVVARVFAVNVALALLALATVALRSHAIDLAALGAGAVLVAWLLFTLARGRR
jgi:UDP-N-acetylmuramyl pentapeptide phosphotransferase/UDP-N-acetylglucosamine-1-phosphate transferase